MTSIKEHCCGADTVFDQKRAEKEYKKYLKKGPSKVTRQIINQLQLNLADFEGKTLLDVGGGVGAISWWFLNSGGNDTISVDASSAYLKLAEKHAIENNWNNRTQFVMGDFVENELREEQIDIISMDKVICCYPDYEAIIDKGCERSQNLISVSYPMDGIISRLLVGIGTLLLKFKTKTFHPYVHSVKDIRSKFRDNGFDRISYDFKFPWHVETYRKVEM